MNQIIKHSPFKVDKKMVKIIENLNFILEHKENWKTAASCDGHGKYPMTLVLQSEGGLNFELFSGRFLPRKKRFYVKDKKGFFFIPETVKVGE